MDERSLPPRLRQALVDALARAIAAELRQPSPSSDPPITDTAGQQLQEAAAPERRV